MAEVAVEVAAVAGGEMAYLVTDAEADWIAVVVAVVVVAAVVVVVVAVGEAVDSAAFGLDAEVVAIVV